MVFEENTLSLLYLVSVTSCGYANRRGKIFKPKQWTISAQLGRDITPATINIQETVV